MLSKLNLNQIGKMFAAAFSPAARTLLRHILFIERFHHEYPHCSLRTLACCCSPAAAQASQGKAPQGFGPTTPTTVENVIKNGADDEYVILRGRFTSHIKSDKYEFQDEAGGVITAELDHDRNWSMVHRGKLMEIRAKVDRDWNSTKLDVKSAKPLE